MDYVVDQVVGKLIEVVKKKNKAGVSVKPFQVSDTLYVLLSYHITPALILTIFVVFSTG